MKTPGEIESAILEDVDRLKQVETHLIERRASATAGGLLRRKPTWLSPEASGFDYAGFFCGSVAA